MLTHATVRSRIDEKREADGQNRDFMRYFTLITKYLIEVAVRKVDWFSIHVPVRVTGCEG